MEKFRPDIYQKSIYQINYENLKEKGIKCLLFDLDNTIIAYDRVKVSKELKELFIHLKELKFKVIIMSNSSKRRLLKLKEQLHVPIIYRAMKPFNINFVRVFKQYRYSQTDVAIIGDQLMTDIKGGNNVGIMTILVDPIKESDAFITKFNRYREHRKLEKLGANGMLLKGRYYE